MRLNKATTILCVLAMLLILPAVAVSAQEKSCFKARYAATRSNDMDIRVTKSDTIDLSRYLNTKAPIYSLSVDAVIEQPREASFTRIVLEDGEGRDWLVLECDRFRNDTSVVSLREFCQETALLFGITPVRLKCYVAGDATLRLTGIHTSDQCPDRGEELTAEKQAERHAALREEQVKAVVASINDYNRKHGRLWRADVTDWALAELNGNGDSRESDPYFANFKYYTDGIYEVGERQDNPTRDVSQYAESFDWRFRHGRDTTFWVNPLRDQANSDYCVAFATVGAAEALVNLYYNKHIGLDLSEKDFINYSGFYNASGSSPASCLKDNGVIDEASLPFTPPYLINGTRPYGTVKVTFESTSEVSPTTPSFNFEENIKNNLIHKGPGIWGFGHDAHAFYIHEADSFYSHYMTLVGYGKVTSNIYYTIINQYNIETAIATGSNGILNNTFWIFKDSFGHRKDSITQHNGYRYVVFNDYSKCGYAYFFSTPAYRRGHTNYESEIAIEDRDGDGYYNWGIGNKPSTCPSWVSDDEDFDDSDPTIGIMNNDGSPRPIENDTIYYAGFNEINTDDWYCRKEINFNYDNSEFTVKGTIVFHPEADICFLTGNTLIVDGGKLVDPTFVLSSGNTGTLILKNGGEIVFTSKKVNFTHPLGLEIQIISGGIRYVRNFW